MLDLCLSGKKETSINIFSLSLQLAIEVMEVLKGESLVRVGRDFSGPTTIAK